MAYTEYFDIKIEQTNIYDNTYDVCSVSYNNYKDCCNAAHYNVATRGSSYYNYYNVCVNNYSDYTNTCSVSYDNVWSYGSSNKHIDTTPPNWSSPWSGVEKNFNFYQFALLFVKI